MLPLQGVVVGMMLAMVFGVCGVQSTISPYVRVGRILQVLGTSQGRLVVCGLSHG